jgi:hypothetical protein
MRAVEFRTEVRRLRSAVRTLTGTSRRAAAQNSKDPDLRSNITHCRAVLVKGIHDEPQRRLIEALLQYMEGQSIASVCAAAHHQSDRFPGPLWVHERRLRIVAGELIRGRGLQTVSYLREIAHVAITVGDEGSAQAWRELADAVDRILQIASREE